MYATHTREEIGKALGRGEGSVRWRCWALGLNTKKASPWTAEETAMLTREYELAAGGSIDLELLAVLLGRPKTGVSRRARELGLTRLDRPSSESTRRKGSAAAAESIRKNGHPRGALGMKHTEEAKRTISRKARAAWADPNSKLNSEAFRQKMSDATKAWRAAGGATGGYSRTKSGKRGDLGGLFLRSSWEANYARYLNWLVAQGEIVGWEYEPRRFDFPIQRGIRSYMPDFRVELNDGAIEWHEVKGWMDPASKTRLKRMAKFYPDETLLVIDSKWFRAAKRQGLPGLIANWEG